MSEFVDETEALQMNVEGMKKLSDSLAMFNESFASWLYIMNMNALTTDWPQVRARDNDAYSMNIILLSKAPTDASFLLAKQRAGVPLV